MTEPNYTNPKIPEGINVSQRHPLSNFLKLSLAIFGLLIAIVLVLGFTAEHLAKYIPFTLEQRIVSKYELIDDLIGEAPKNQRVTRYLRELGARITSRMDLPEGMDITIHYVDDDTMNAYATLAGHVVIFRGLLETLPHENALAMVMAHEIAHVYHRHPVMAMGRGAVVMLALSSIAGLSGSQLLGGILSDATVLTLHSFNRGQEREADRTALHALARLYGHVAGADELFRQLLKHDNDNLKVPAFMSTHPLTQDRIDTIQRYAQAQGWSTAAKTQPLPKLY